VRNSWGALSVYRCAFVALDQIITQIMENSQGHPVPATEEIMEKLPREVLEEKCELSTWPNSLTFEGLTNMSSASSGEGLCCVQGPVPAGH
jgi:hypothetical protein